MIPIPWFVAHILTWPTRGIGHEPWTMKRRPPSITHCGRTVGRIAGLPCNHMRQTRRNRPDHDPPGFVRAFSLADPAQRTKKKLHFQIYVCVAGCAKSADEEKTRTARITYKHYSSSNLGFRGQCSMQCQYVQTALKKTKDRNICNSDSLILQCTTIDGNRSVHQYTTVI